MKLHRIALAAPVALLLAVATAAPANADTRGSRWQQPVVYVYDATSAGSLYAVAEAASEWSASGVNLAMTTDPTAAHITVREEYVCGSLQCYAGHFTSTESGGVITGCQISVDPGLSDEPKLGQHAALHEMGHCLGLEHNAKTIRRSVMNASVNYDTAVTRPSSYDIREAKTLYR